MKRLFDLRLVPLIFAAFLTACTGGENDPVAIPRRHAFPRIELPDSSFVVVQSSPLNMQINRSAVASRTCRDDSTVWVTVVYPGLSAEIYFTFTPVDHTTVDDVIDNRVERIALNLGDNAAEMTDFTTRGGLSAKIVSGASVTTPVQFIATDRRSVVVSGSAYLSGLSPSTRDSLAPVIAMLRRDIFHTLSTLSNDR